MVAQRNTYFRCTAFIYLSLLLGACTNTELTIIELQHLKPTEVENIITRYSKDKIEYDIVNQKIIFYTNKENIQGLTHLLEQLDSKPNQFLLSFTWGKIKRYSTTLLPSPLIIGTTQPITININRNTWLASLEASNNNTYSLKFINQPKEDHQNLDVRSVKLADGTRVKFNQSAATQSESSFSITLVEGVETKINNPLLPKGLHLKLERF